MFKMKNMFLSLILLIATKALTVHSMKHFLIIPNNTTLCNSTQFVNSSCLTLQQFVKNHEQYPKNITLHFTTGQHVIAEGLLLHNVINIFLKGELNESSKPEIICSWSSGFSFQTVVHVHIENLVFKECFSNNSDGGAISVSGAETVNISQCLFINNSVTANRAKGGAVKLEMVKIVTIQENSFIHNSAVCSKLVHINSSIECIQGCTASGGAIAAQLVSSLTIVDTFFTGNIASCSGGAIDVILTLISTKVISTVFTRNIVSFTRGHGGGLNVALSKNTLQISDSLFEDNHAYGGGSVEVFSLLFPLTSSISNCSFFYNSAGRFGGGSIFAFGTTLIIRGTSFFHNIAVDGGAVLADSSLTFISNSSFLKNIALDQGGGIFFFNTHFQMEDTLLNNNTAFNGGAIVALFSTISYTANVSSCIFRNNFGGAVWLGLWGEPNCTVSCKGYVTTFRASDISVVNSSFEWNTGEYGGAIYVFRGVFRAIDNVFHDNLAVKDGGAISVLNSIAYLIHNNFTRNTALEWGGAIDINFGIIQANFNTYKYNQNLGKLGGGGAISGTLSTITSKQDEYVYNWANVTGGARFTTECDMIDENLKFEFNSASQTGGAVSAVGGTFQSVNSSYISNIVGINGAALAVIDSQVDINGNIFRRNKVNLIKTSSFLKDGNILVTVENISIFLIVAEQFNLEAFPIFTITMIRAHGKINDVLLNDNLGSVQLFYSTLNFSGAINFMDNFGVAGGALFITQSNINFEQYSTINIASNIASLFGGGIFITQSEMRIFSTYFSIADNRAGTSGGGICSYQSRLLIQPVNTNFGLVLIANNSATQDGGGMLAISSNINIFRGSVLFTNNNGLRGGGITLLKDSIIYLIKLRNERYDELNLKLTLSNNSAMFGGAIFVDDNTNPGVLCEQAKRNFQYSILSAECFLQILAPNTLARPTTSDSLNFANIFFESNIASISGDDLYGGLLDRCQISGLSELYMFGFISIHTGLDYIKLIAKFQIDSSPVVRYPFNPQFITSAITREDLKELISSDPVQLCFCLNSTHNCTLEWPTIFARKGESFTVSAVTVDQAENPVRGRAVANVLSDGTRLKIGQSIQGIINGSCTELVYSVISFQSNATFEIYPEGPCDEKGISSKTLAVTFLPCECPSGLQPAPLDNECKCECDSTVETYLRNCKVENESITVVRESQNVWIHYVNQKNMSGFLFNSCPYDYCVKRPVNLSISLPLGVDKQCTFNRTGIMCGECEEGLSLVFGSSRCFECNNNYLALLIAFALAGIALVLLILILNMTVAIGTIHGLVLYANIVGANSPVFFLPRTALHLFVSWVNLDLGIETCFYNGMDSYAKVLLQLVFPLYIILLSVMIIIVSNYWGWFAGLIGRKNPVATLCTLFFLSYSKLLRFIITSLQFTFLTYPDVSRKILWTFNPNITYFIAAHTPFFMIAFVIIVLGSIYTILLFFGQWVRKIKRRKLLTLFFQSNQYNAFIDAYHAPFVFKHRYWVGVLLFIRIIHHLLSSFVEESFHPLIISCLTCVLLLLKLMIGKVYKNWMINLLESLFIINLLLFSVSTYTVTIIDGDQVALANTSVSISFAIFLFFALYHAHFYNLKNFKVYQMLESKVKWFVQQLTLKKGRSNESTYANAGVELHLAVLRSREPLLDYASPTSDQVNTPTAALRSLAIPPVTTTEVCIEEDSRSQYYNAS